MLLTKKGKILNKIQILQIKTQKLIEFRKIKQRNLESWTYEELLYLVHGSEKYEKNWNKILENYGKHFDIHQKSIDLLFKYQELKKNEKNFKLLKSEAASFIND